MPDLLEHMYCAQQINIPPNLPYILKQYAKAAIRTQPYDLLYWSAAYFRAKANNLPPPVKERLEYPPFESPSRLSPGFLKVLHKQLGDHEYVRVEILYEKWLGVCLVKEALDSMLKIGQIVQRVPWLKFVAIAAGHICTSLSKTMVLVCEVLTDQPDGGAAWISVDKFVELYKFLAGLNCGPDPPHAMKHVELDIETPSLTSTQASSSVAEGKERPGTQMEEKDSTAGLMVWPDIKPDQKSDRVRSPKHEDEPGASSELGVEVYDDAKGTVTELVTLYPATTKATFADHDTVTSTVASVPHSRTETKPRSVKITNEPEGDSSLSHTSLKENEDWKKIEAKNLEEGMRESDPLDLDKLDAVSLSGKTATKTVESENQRVEEGEEDHENQNDQVGEEQVEVSEEQHDDDSNQMSEEERLLTKTGEETESHHATTNENTLEECAPTPSQTTTESQGKTDSQLQKTIMESAEDSEIGLNQTITMANFVGTRNVGYSVVEIRKGRVGDRSLDHIDSQAALVATDTVHQLGVESDESMGFKDEESTILYWDHVPGIGPVIPEAQVRAVVEYMQYWATKQQGLVGPRNINHLLCPPLDLPPPTEQKKMMY